jgi:hypothetical protein
LKKFFGAPVIELVVVVVALSGELFALFLLLMLSISDGFAVSTVGG